MAIEIRETFRVDAPAVRVWALLMDPARVASCMPGATLDEVVDERTFAGSVRVRLGAISASYKGRVRFEEVDEASRTVRAVAEGRETGGGTARGTLTSRVTALSEGATEVVAEASIDLTGKVVQVGRGMIQAVSAQLFKEFVARVRAEVEAGEAVVSDGVSSAPAAPVAKRDDAIRLLPLLLGTIGAAIMRLLRRIFGRPDPEHARIDTRSQGGDR
ncbi:MAG: SRPBCC family protein [Deltaproteobacteria bacterium]|nr:SRPBCC family protein [Deltaproteobacteria bacterium]